MQGKVVGLIGQNGAGKSTLVKLILSLMNPRSGKIVVGDYDVREERDKALSKIGVMFEQADFPNWYNLYEYLVFMGRIRGLSQEEAEKESWSLLEKFSLSDKSQEMYQKLSAGMKQKYAIAVAIIGRPKYVFLDEPTANLDVKARSQTLDFIQELALENDMQIVILSHILHDLEKICDEIIILHKGKIKGQYKMEDLQLERYVKIYSIRVPDPERVESLIEQLTKIGVTNIHKKGILIEFSLNRRDQLDEIKKWNPTPRASILEQVFIDEVGDEIN